MFWKKFTALLLCVLLVCSTLPAAMETDQAEASQVSTDVGTVEPVLDEAAPDVDAVSAQPELLPDEAAAQDEPPAHQPAPAETPGDAQPDLAVSPEETLAPVESAQEATDAPPPDAVEEEVEAPPRETPVDAGPVTLPEVVGEEPAHQPAPIDAPEDAQPDPAASPEVEAQAPGESAQEATDAPPPDAVEEEVEAPAQETPVDAVPVTLPEAVGEETTPQDPEAETVPAIEPPDEVAPAASPDNLASSAIAPAPTPDVTQPPEPGTEPVHQASKALPKRSPSAASATQTTMRGNAAVEVWVSLDTDYLNLNKSAGTAVTWQIHTSGQGEFVYAFDIYKDGNIYQYMPAYQYASSYAFVPTEPGNYSVKAFVYDYQSWQEKIEWCWDSLGVSRLMILGINSDLSLPLTGDQLTWTVHTQQSSGRLSYYYTLFYSPDGHDWSVMAQSPGYLDILTFSHRASQAGYYRLDARVWEKDITYRDLDASSALIYVDYGDPTLVVNGVYPSNEYPWIDETITWTVDAYGVQGALQCEFHLFNGDARISSTEWAYGRSFETYLQRSGSYRVEAFVRDTAFPDLVYQINSDTLGVSDLYIDANTLSPATAHPGDVITSTTTIGGGSGEIYYLHAIYLDGSLVGMDHSFDGVTSFVAERTGSYAVLTEVYDEYVSLPTTRFIEVTERPAPAFSTVAASSATAIKTSWNKVTRATGYELWRSTSLNGTYSRVYKGASRTYSDTGRVSGRPYYYKVRAYTSQEGNTYYGLFSAPQAAVALQGGVIVSVAAVNGTAVKISWNAVAGASGYELWRSSSRTGTYTRVYAGTARAFTNSRLRAGAVWYYKVRAYKTAGTQRLYGVYGAVKPGVPLAAPTAPSAVVSSPTSLTLSWKAVPGATGYELLRSTSASGTYTRVYRGTALSFRNTSLRTGTTYYYKVRAYKVVSRAYHYSPLSAYRAARPL
ncbi:MAG: hypothetical protein GXY84_07785 [Clostridiales bacterium]|nr:hypothetical protein [Clostridiales bacterium]